jgi:hypothetical protein
MKLSRPLRWHTANLKSGAQIRMKLKPIAVKMITRPPAHKKCGHDELSVVANGFGYCSRDTQRSAA